MTLIEKIKNLKVKPEEIFMKINKATDNLGIQNDKTETKESNMEKVYYKQLGNSSGLALSGVSTSFIIMYYKNNQPEFALVDCGYNVLQEAAKAIKELFAKINYIDKELTDYEALSYINRVFVTHAHMDHVAEIEKLIYIKYFMENKKLNISASVDVLSELKNKLPKEKIFKECQIVDKKLYNFTRLANIKETDPLFEALNDNLYVSKFNTFHPTVFSCGFTFINEATEKALMITGDTKAIKLIEEVYHYLKNKNYNVTVFHDFSKFNQACNSIHACENDMQIYSEEFMKDVILVHTDEDFDNSWKEL
jgi:ribonuclease BN (tRNA processing enzyme)